MCREDPGSEFSSTYGKDFFPMPVTIQLHHYYVVYDEACIAQKEHTLKMNLLPESQTKTKKLSDTFWTFSVI
jgi:hypothetical protein